MGKKSRKGKPKAGRKGGGVPRAPAVDALAPLGTTVPPPERADEKKPPLGAACWICLDGDPDDDGKPIVRDCSCRGDDAGFAHISCLTKYAEGKTRDMMSASELGQDYNEPWEICPHCRREYQHLVAIDMAKSELSFIDEYFPPDLSEIAKLSALTVIAKEVIASDNAGKPDLIEEGKRAATEMVTIVQRSDRQERYTNSKLMFAYAALGKLAEVENPAMALEYYGKVRKLKASLGDNAGMRAADFAINRLKSVRDGRIEGSPSEQNLDDLRCIHAKSVKERGEESSNTVRSGIILITALLTSAKNSLECERLAAKLRAISRRVHGPEHDLTDRIESGLRESRVRRVMRVRDGRPVEYRVQQVNDEERKYVATSPHDGVVSEIEFDDDYMIMPGTPVVCLGLKNAQHLNGKLGDVRSFDDYSGRYVVRFEDETLNKASVRPANLRIVIDLPDES